MSPSTCFISFSFCILTFCFYFRQADAASCFISSVYHVEHCDSQQHCIPVSSRRSQEDCERFAKFLKYHHPIYTADEFACQHYVFANHGCEIQGEPERLWDEDIILTKDQRTLLSGTPSALRGAIKTTVGKWPLVGDRYVIPWTIDPTPAVRSTSSTSSTSSSTSSTSSSTSSTSTGWNDEQLDALEWAMLWIAVNTNLRFVERTTEANYIEFVESATKCAAHLGMTGGRQPIYLVQSCRNRLHIMHEIFHSAGMIHEHQRFDRDAHIDVLLDNVLSNELAQFTLENNATHQVVTPYDTASIMHYWSTAFANDTNGTDVQTILPLDASLSLLDSHLASPTECDFFTINQMYPFTASKPCGGNSLVNACSNSTCTPNTVVEICEPLWSCPGKSCEDYCKYHCGGVYAAEYCQLLISTEILHRVLNYLDS